MEKLRIHCLQHVAFEGLGCIEDWVHDQGHTLTYTKLYKEAQFPHKNEIDWLIIMGGPMSVYDEDQYSWLKGEKQYIKEVIDAGKIVLGICLGSQFIAAALGANVYPGVEQEIGWFNLELSNEGQKSALKEAHYSPVFHWHGDTFDLPVGAERIASSKLTHNQAFSYNNGKVVALQFHLEVKAENVITMLNECYGNLEVSNYVQPLSEISTFSPELIKQNNQLMFALLGDLDAKKNN